MSSHNPVLGILTSLLFSIPTHAGHFRIPEVKREDPYQFIRAVILSLSEVQSVASRNQPGKSTVQDNHAETLARAADQIYRMKKDKEDYSCAASILSGYTTAENKDIRENATKVQNVYLDLVALNNQAT